MGLTLPTYGIGAAGIGNLYQAISDADAAHMIEAAQRSAFDYIDTAPFYGHGLSEARLGDYFRQSGWHPHISTKVGRVLRPADGAAIPDNGFVDPLPLIPTFDYSATGIAESFKGSQERLGIDCVDALLLHDIGALTHGDAHSKILALALNEALPAMAALKAAGKTKAIGLGVNEVAVCREVMAHHHLDCILLAGRYTLLEHRDTLGFLNECLSANTRIIIGGAFNSGLLAAPQNSDAKYDYVDAPQWAIDRAKALQKVCASHNVSLQAAALQFCAAHPAVISVIPGVGKTSHVDDAKRWTTEPIPAALWDELKDRNLIEAEAPIPA